MAVKIRLKRMGKIRAPHYRIVVADSRTKRDGKNIEELGIYQPKFEPSVIRVDSDRVQHWLSVGAQPSEPVLAILKKTGDWQKFKGEPLPEQGLLEQPVKADKRAAYDAALAEAYSEPDSEAVTKKKAAKKSTKKSDKASEDDKSEASGSDEATASEQSAESSDEAEKSSESES